MATKYCSTCKKELETEAENCPTCASRLFTLRNEPAPAPIPNSTSQPIIKPDEKPSIQADSQPSDLAGPDPVNVPSYAPEQPAAQGNSTLKTLLIIGAVILGLYGMYFYNGVNELHRQLLRDWERVEASDENPDVMYTLKLDFEENTYDYIFDSFFITSTISSSTYKVTSPNTIVTNPGTILESTHTVEFNSTKDMMTITPALTSVATSEDWFNLGY